jgi:hypothetical protein
MVSEYRPGDYIVYRKAKSSSNPGPNACEVYPAPNGDTYHYAVKKYYRVLGVLPGGKVLVYTRQGRQHTLSAADPSLRRAAWWERLLYRGRFPNMPTPAAAPSESASVAHDD